MQFEVDARMDELNDVIVRLFEVASRTDDCYLDSDANSARNSS